MTQRKRHRHSAITACAAALALTLSACSGDQSTPSSPESKTPTPTVSSSSTPHTAPVNAATPVSVQVPAAGIDSQLLHLGLRPDGSLEVPPTDPGSPASWYNKSPEPGNTGPAILLGHVNDTNNQDGVFGRLDELTIGDVITVTRADQSTVSFEVTLIEQYSKNNFPSQKVYGDTHGPEIRLITCDGYDPTTGLWGDNLVVYGRMV